MKKKKIIDFDLKISINTSLLTMKKKILGFDLEISTSLSWRMNLECWKKFKLKDNELEIFTQLTHFFKKNPKITHFSD